MIITCANCKKRYKLDDSKITARRVRLKCVSCGSDIFFNKDTETPSDSATVAAKTHCVLVSSEDAEIRRAVEETLSGSDVAVVGASDGDETVRVLEKSRPRIVVLDVALPGFHSFAICDLVKSKAGMQNTRVILTSAAFNRKRYKRKPTSLFGADGYIEKYDLANELIEKINSFKVMPELKVRPVDASAKAATTEAAVRQQKAAASESKEAAGKAVPVDREVHEKAKRLARVIAADIVLYNRKKLDDTVNRGNIHAVFKDEIEEGIKYFKKRLPFPVSAETYLAEALQDFLLDARKKEAGANGPCLNAKRHVPA
jgi:predicted Zn finger-like uncharacterized protein